MSKQWIASSGGRAPDQTTITFSCRTEVLERVKSLAMRDNRSVSNFMMHHMLEYYQEQRANKVAPWVLLKKDA